MWAKSVTPRPLSTGLWSAESTLTGTWKRIPSAEQASPRPQTRESSRAAAWLTRSTLAAFRVSAVDCQSATRAISRALMAPG